MSRYQRHEKIGQGAWGEVYRATDPLTKEEVAVKVIDRAQGFPKSELSYSRRITDPHVCRTFDYCFKPGRTIFCARCVHGLLRFTYLTGDTLVGPDLCSADRRGPRVPHTRPTRHTHRANHRPPEHRKTRILHRPSCQETRKVPDSIMAKLEIDINKLSPEERLDLIEELWDSLSTDPAKIPLTDAQANELDRRLAEMDQDDSLGIPWETVLARIRERK